MNPVHRTSIKVIESDAKLRELWMDILYPLERYEFCIEVSGKPPDPLYRLFEPFNTGKVCFITLCQSGLDPTDGAMIYDFISRGGLGQYVAMACDSKSSRWNLGRPLMSRSDGYEQFLLNLALFLSGKKGCSDNPRCDQRISRMLFMLRDRARYRP